MTSLTSSSISTEVLLFVVDDDSDTRLNLRDILELDGYTVAEASSAHELFALPDWDKVSLILLDRKLPDGTPESLLPKIQQKAPQASVIMVTGYGDVASAVSALRLGASDYIIKPINADVLRASIRRELAHQRSERQLQALFENALTGLLIFDGNRVVIDANPAACSMFRLEKKELIGRQLEGLVAPGQFEESESSDHPFSLERPSGECQLIRGDNVVIDVEHQTTLNFSPGLSAISLRDITERKQSEKRALQAERLAAIGETMTALIHESRNALQRSFACLEMLALEVEDRPTALDLVQRTQRAQTQLSDLYEEVRQWAAPVNLCRERVNLASLWREAWNYVIQTHPGKDIRLVEDIRCEPHCRVDASKITQVFRNIFENAVEVSPNPGHVELQCSSGTEQGKNELHIRILDHGPGLTPEQLTRIFEPFFTTKAKGTGLGMAIANRIVTAHHGKLAVQSPQGACIEVTLPKGVT